MRLADKTIAAAAVVMAVATIAQAREEQAFASLDDLVKRVDYIVIASVKRKSPEPYMDGWVKYHCRFLYWLKAPSTAKLERAIMAERKRTVEPYPLWKWANTFGTDFPPGAPRTDAVILVDSHEKAFNRLSPGEEQGRALSNGKLPLRDTYHLFFLNKGSGDRYQELGTYHSILPVSPDLDIRKLPSEPHRQWADHTPVEMGLQDAVRLIVKDFIDFKEMELKSLKADLQEVLAR